MGEAGGSRGRKEDEKRRVADIRGKEAMEARQRGHGSSKKTWRRVEGESRRHRRYWSQNGGRRGIWAMTGDEANGRSNWTKE